MLVHRGPSRDLIGPASCASERDGVCTVNLFKRWNFEMPCYSVSVIMRVRNTPELLCCVGGITRLRDCCVTGYFWSSLLSSVDTRWFPLLTPSPSPERHSEEVFPFPVVYAWSQRNRNTMCITVIGTLVAEKQKGESTNAALSVRNKLLWVTAKKLSYELNIGRHWLWAAIFCLQNRCFSHSSKLENHGFKSIINSNSHWPNKPGQQFPRHHVQTVPPGEKPLIVERHDIILPHSGDFPPHVRWQDDFKYYRADFENYINLKCRLKQKKRDSLLLFKMTIATVY